MNQTKLLSKKGKLSDNEFDSGLCLLIYAANLAQSPVQELTYSGINIMIHNMIQANQNQSLIRKMRNEITSFMFALSEKYSTLHSAETILVYPSLFDSIQDDSSKHELSTTNNTFDSNWTLKQKRKSDAISDGSLFDSSMDDSYKSGYSRNQHLTTLKRKRKPDGNSNLNYITSDTFSQESHNDQESYSKTSNKMEYKDNESSNQRVQGGYDQESYSKTSNKMEYKDNESSNQRVQGGYDNSGRRYRTSQRLTKDINRVITRKNRTIINDTNSSVEYIRLPWAKLNTNEYTKAVEVINNCYRKMLIIGKCREVFRNKVSDLFKAKSMKEFTLAKDNIERRYVKYLQLDGIKLHITIPTELVPHPKNQRRIASLPNKRSVIVKEEILHHEFQMKILNIYKCKICLELVMINDRSQQSGRSYTCQKCQKRKDPMYYLKNNLHPIWYEISNNGSFVRDQNNNKVPRFDIPLELKRLSMAEKFLIRRCSNYIPSVHLSNGVFALKGHCVTFPQDISGMCNELPLRKESMVVFIRYLGNKDTTDVYPKTLRVNKQNVLEALFWLKKHNPLYSNINITERNLDWMQGQEEVSVATNAKKFKTKNSKHFRIITNEAEFVSPSAINDTNDDGGDNIVISTMHANQPNPLPNGKNASIIHSFRRLADTSGQLAQVMNFPPIDHDSPIR